MRDWTNAKWVDPQLGWKPLEVPDLPPRVLLDLATKCNLRCPMCPVWGSEDNNAIDSVKGVMDLKELRKLLDTLTPAHPMVQPSIYGEPTLAPKIREWVLDLKSRGMPVAMNTNGLSISEDLARFFVEQEVDSIMFSIDSVTKATLKKIRGVDKLEKIENAVFRMLKARGTSPKPRIGVSFTIQNDNQHELEAFIKRWVGVVDVVRTCPIFENGTFQGVVEPEIRQPCPALYKSMPVHNDGQVTICCLDGFKDTNVGNVFKEGVDAVWQGESFAKVRYYHETGQWDKVPFCKSCNGWAQYDYEEEVREGILIRRSPQFTYYNKIDQLSNWQGQLLGGHEAPPVELTVSSVGMAE
jgi:MoaA/NifB/PqqE/SkfB family radical SAM enzyme